MTKIVLAHELLEQGITQACVAERLGISRRTVIPQLMRSVEDWLYYYHYQRPHLSLGMRPPLQNQCDISK